LVEVGETIQASQGDHEPETTVLGADRSAAMRSAIARLSERERQVLALVHVQELSGAEIGRMLGVSESRVSQSLSDPQQAEAPARHVRRDRHCLGRLPSAAMAEESHEERVNRELIELLNELRVALPGVQVLFAFLLAVPFSQRFAEVTELQRDTFMVALLATLAGSVFLIAPTAYHRIRFRERDKEALLQISNVFAIVGVSCLAIGMTAVVFLVTDMIFKGVVTTIVTASTAALFATVWFVLPLARKAG
jgi:DNA-binding CsgD family transcriptional regulator